MSGSEILTGLPGTGKTHLAGLLHAEAPFTLVGSDTLRAAIVDDPAYSPIENSLVYRLANSLLWRLLRERRDVIYDAVNLSEGRRQSLRVLALDAGARPITVLVTAPEPIIRSRLARRREIPVQPGDSQADWGVYRKLLAQAERVAHQHIVIDTTQDIAQGLVVIFEAIGAANRRELTR
ncbi:MAG: ATP-binding protein [Anaerolineae bacterium]|nr:ATP-binding protein [Anaerolineae bacterium]